MRGVSHTTLTTRPASYLDSATWDAIGKLAAVATIRTLLNYFLGRELTGEQQRQGASPQR